MIGAQQLCSYFQFVSAELQVDRWFVNITRKWPNINDNKNENWI